MSVSNEGTSKLAGALTVHRATPSAFPSVLEIYRDAAQWLNDRGITQWNVVLKPAYEPYLLRRIEEHEVYFGLLKGEFAATVCVQWTDADYWGEQGSDGLAGYIHGLAVRRRFAGRQIGEHLLRWACDYIRAAGRHAVRLDCAADNPALCKYYETRGFTPVRVVAVQNYGIQQFEMPLASRRSRCFELLRFPANG